MAPINSDPSFTVAATPGAVGASRWSAPELINPVRKGNTPLVIESKAADVFAFAMLAAEVFTGKIPFEGQKNEAVLLRISRGGRMVMPGNPQAVGLTTEIWKLLGSCWNQDPKKRPTIEDIVKRWRGFAENSNNNVVLECVQAPLVIRTPSSVLCSTLYDRLRKPQLVLGSAPDVGRFRAKSEVTQPPTRFKPTRLRTMSAPAQLRTTSVSAQPRVTPETAQPGRDAGALTRRRRRKPYYF